MKLPVKARFRLTILLLLISIAGSVVSLGMSLRNRGELYPFFYWKLYTQPIGWDGKTEVLRMYVKPYGEPQYERVPLRSYPAFSKDDVSYIFDYAKGIMHTDSSKAYAIFSAVCKQLEPGYESYRIVKETYNPVAFLQMNSFRVDSVVVQIP